MASLDHTLTISGTSVNPSDSGSVSITHNSSDRVTVEATAASGYTFVRFVATDTATGDTLTSTTNPASFHCADFPTGGGNDITATATAYFTQSAPQTTLTIGGKTVTDITISAKSVKSISIDGVVVWEKQ